MDINIEWKRKAKKEEGSFVYTQRRYAYIKNFVLGYYYKKILYLDSEKRKVGMENWECVLRSCKENESESENPNRLLTPIIMGDEQECEDAINNTYRKMFLF